MLACGCGDPVVIVTHLGRLGLLGAAGLAVGLVCLVGLLVGGLVVLGHLMRGAREHGQGRGHGREREDDGAWVEGETRAEGETWADGHDGGLASFRWEADGDVQ